MLRSLVAGLVVCLASTAWAVEPGAISRAEVLYQKTDYEAALRLVQNAPANDAAAQYLAGRVYFMLGDFKRSSDALERAVAADPEKSDAHLWVGRAYGRRAETASPFTAPGLAVKSRMHLEKAVELDSKNLEAINDLMEFYLQAPGFLGGGTEKATALVAKVGRIDPVEVHFALAHIAERKKEYKQAEEQLRRCVELAPHQVGRLTDLAKFLAKQGRIEESDAVFEKASKVAPDNPKVLYSRASTYVQEKRNLDVAQRLLEKYLQAPNLTPEDPSREAAQKLLKQAMAR